jgi:hypothetical protein
LGYKRVCERRNALLGAGRALHHKAKEMTEVGSVEVLAPSNEPVVGLQDYIRGELKLSMWIPEELGRILFLKLENTSSSYNSNLSLLLLFDI